MQIRNTQKLKPYLLILPALALAVVFSYRPFLVTLLNSLYTVNMAGTRMNFVGLETYGRLFASQSFQASLSNTLRFTLFFVPVNLVFCLSAALLSNREGKLATLNQVFFFLPMAVGLSSTMMIFKMMFNPSIGIINQLFSLDVQWFNDGKAAMALLVMAGVYLDLGFDFLLLHAALRNIPKELVEVAKLEGAGWYQTFSMLQAPLIAPTVVFILVTSIKDAMLISSPVLILTEGGPFRSTQTLVYQMYLEGFKSGNYAVGSAIATIVFLLTFLILLALLHLERRRVYYS
ncbi:MAG: carbohydrate ABC transporter permease [Sphaerochaeta sp.]|uniref:carbohydrate ABC transporter permease n=1 Tax=Sphaerochaeta sp. TaxID=1972642 RepID=UPI002FC768F8